MPQLNTNGATSITVNGLTKGQQYNFDIRAVNSSGTGRSSVIKTGPISLPNPPINLNVSQGPGADQITLSWTLANNSPILSQRISYSNDQGVSWRIINLSSTVTVYTFSNLVNKPYLFKMVSSNSDGFGDYGPTSSPVFPPSPVPALITPTSSNLLIWGHNLIDNPSYFGHVWTMEKDDYGNGWIDIAAGRRHILAIKNDKTLWSWGRAGEELGLGSLPWTTTDSGGPSDPDRYVKQPRQVGSASNWTKVSAGWGFSAAINENKELWMWGTNLLGQLGDGTSTGKNVPTRIMPNISWKNVVCGTYTTFAITENDELYAWGRNDSGEVGNRSRTEQNQAQTPVKITSVKDGSTIRQNQRWYHVSNGNGFTVAVGDNGSIYAWGLNLRGCLAAPSSFNRPSYITTPRRINGLSQIVTSSKSVVSISAGWYHVVVVNSAGEMWAWGSNQYNELGQNDADPPTQINTSDDMLFSASPLRISFPDKNWKFATVGWKSCIAIDSENKLYGWGYNALPNRVIELADVNDFRDPSNPNMWMGSVSAVIDRPSAITGSGSYSKVLLSGESQWVAALRSG